MFAKLMKWEFRQTARVMLPLLGAALLLCGGGLASRGVLYVLPLGPQWLETLSALLYALMTFVLFAGVFVAYFYAVIRFYRMLGNEGYLMLTLPVTPAQHIGATLITGCVWVAAAMLFSLLLPGTSFSTVITSSDEQVAAALSEFWPGMPLYLSFGLFLLAMLFLSMMWMYFICALGAQWPQQRFGATVVCYLVTSFLVQIVFVMAVGVFTYIAAYSPLGASLYNSFMANPTGTLTVWMLCASAAVAALTAALFFIVRWMISKRLNLA